MSSEMIIYSIEDEPVTCPVCGARTDFRDSPEVAGQQEHCCLACGYEFVTEFIDTDYPEAQANA